MILKGQTELNMNYPEKIALGVESEERTEIEKEEDEPEIPSLLKMSEDVEVGDDLDGTTQELMKEEFGVDMTDVQEVAHAMFEPEEVVKEAEGVDERVPYEKRVAMAEHGVDVTDSELFALNNLRQKAEQGMLDDIGGDIDEPVMDAITKVAEEAVEEAEGVTEKAVFQSAVVHATSMADQKREAGEMAAEFVKEFSDDTELAVEARKEAMEGIEKARQYVDDPSEAPDDVQVKEGQHGALFWLPEERGEHGTQPVKNDLLEMDREDLAKLSDVDPNDPDNFTTDDTTISRQDVLQSMGKEGGHPNEWPFEPNSDGVDTCARRFGPEEHIENARAFCENWYLDEEGEIPEGAEYVDMDDVEEVVEDKMDKSDQLEISKFVSDCMDKGITYVDEIARLGNAVVDNRKSGQ